MGIDEVIKECVQSELRVQLMRGPWGVSTWKGQVEHSQFFGGICSDLVYEISYTYCRGFFKIILFLAALYFHCCSDAFSSCGKQGLITSGSVRASHCGGSSFVEPRHEGTQASIVAAPGLQSTGFL